MTLGQTQLLDPPPTRRLIVPWDAGAWWGVDPGTTRVALASITGSGTRGVSLRAFPRGLEGGERLDTIYTATRELANEVAVLCGVMPGVIVVEQPSGKQPNPALSYAVGAIMAGLYAGWPARVLTVNAQSWRKTACGAGNAYKPYDKKGKLGPIEEYGVYRWATGAGYSGSSYDEVDAWGIAEYARKTFALDPRGKERSDAPT